MKAEVLGGCGAVNFQDHCSCSRQVISEESDSDAGGVRIWYRVENVVLEQAECPQLLPSGKNRVLHPRSVFLRHHLRLWHRVEELLTLSKLAKRP